MNPMNIFGDDETEVRNNTNFDDSDDFFFSDIDISPIETDRQSNATRTSRNSTSSHSYGYTGRNSTRNMYQEPEDRYSKRGYYNNSSTDAVENNKRRQKDRDAAYNGNVRYYNTNKAYKRPKNYIGHSNMVRRQPTRYGSSAPHFTKEQNGKFIISLLGVALIALLIIFVCRGDSAFAGVTAVIIIMYVMNYLTKNTKGSRRR